MTTLQHIALTKLHESPLNPRRAFDEKSLKELADNLAQVGVLTPLLVRPHAKGYEIAAGHRRYRAAKIAKLAEVPCVVRELDDKAFLEIMTIENLQRENIHPLDEALGYQALLKLASTDKNDRMDVAAIAAKVGKSESYVYQRLKLAELVKPAQKAFLEDKITAGHAILIARLQPKDQAEALKAYEQSVSFDGAMGVRQLADWIEDNLHLDLEEAPFEAEDATLVPGAGSCADCPKRTGAQPALFPDIQKGDTCTDPACFQAKARAHGARAVKEAKATGTPLVNISTKSYSNRKGVLTEQNYKAVSKRCDSAKLGVIVETYGAQDKHLLNQTRLICDNKKCKQHWPQARKADESASRKDSAAEKKLREERKVEQQKYEAEQRANAKAVKLILEKNPKPALGLADLQSLAIEVLENIYEDECLTPLCEQHGLKVAARYVGSDPDYTAAVTKAVRDAKDTARVAALLFGVLVCIAGDRALADLAKRNRVDLAKLRKEALAEIKAKEPAKVQTSAKPKLKKAA